MNSLILCHLMWSYLTLSSQLELPPIQSLLLIIFFPINDSIKKLNKAVSSDLRNLTNWLNANKISVNVSKTELILFKLKMKKLDFNLKPKTKKQKNLANRISKISRH